MSTGNEYQTYIKDCDCTAGGIIFHEGNPVCRWCRSPYAKGGLMNYLPEHFKPTHQQQSNDKDGLIGVAIKGNVVDYNNTASIKIDNGKASAIAMDGFIFLPEKDSSQPEQPKERIEVVAIEDWGMVWKDKQRYFVMKTSLEVPKDKYPAIKFALEAVLNDNWASFEKHTLLPVLAEQQLREAEEKAFENARMKRFYTDDDGEQKIVNQFRTFQDYLINKQQP